ncbi:DMT family transporter [Clostridium sp. MB05]|uniref:DMT family transporter n=1 Tax=Clostridium sp. MB05 TaxID=3376682 RepID=UPI0039828347
MIFTYYLLSLIAGFALTLQVGINGGLRLKLENPILSSLISFSVGALGLLVVFIFSLLNGSTTCININNIKNIKWWMLMGGLLGAFYILMTILVPPKIGFANMLSIVICGQIVLAVIFDHFGILGNEIHLITPIRIIGVMVLVLGVYIIQAN